jgi:2'-phosphotransferase
MYSDYQGNRGNRGGGKRGGGPGGSKRDGKGGDDVMVSISKALTYLLRHGAEKEGLDMREDGYVLVEEILNHKTIKSKKVDLELLKKIVETNDKKRFELADIENEKSGGKKELFIRATQGHTLKMIDDEKLLKKIEDLKAYPVVVHGTYFKFWSSIKKEGLKCMSRNHIHLAPGIPGEKDVISGMRNSCDVIIEIDMGKAIEDKIEFFVSSNNVILTKGIDGVLPMKYFSKAYTRNDKESLL